MNVGFVETTSAQVDVRLALSFMSSHVPLSSPKNDINWATAWEHDGVFGASLIKTSPLASREAYSCHCVSVTEQQSELYRLTAIGC